LQDKAQRELDGAKFSKAQEVQNIRLLRTQQMHRIEANFIRRETTRTSDKEEQQRLKLLSKFVVTNIDMEEAHPPKSKIGPLIISPVEATQLEEIRNTDVSNTNTRTISSDGSMINADSDNIAMAFGVVDNTNNIT
ncbi:hypothetical protein BGZ76_008246, partial [Entomortierella beljakovae]